jgi:hypothetical protein
MFDGKLSPVFQGGWIQIGEGEVHSAIRSADHGVPDIGIGSPIEWFDLTLTHSNLLGGFRWQVMVVRECNSI